MSCCGPRKSRDFDEGREGLSDADLARFGSDAIECPECGAEVYHDAAMCPQCGHAMTEASLRKRTPVWIPLLAAGAALGMILWYLMSIV